jgi:ribosome-binding factor A
MGGERSIVSTARRHLGQQLQMERTPSIEFEADLKN